MSKSTVRNKRKPKKDYIYAQKKKQIKPAVPEKEETAESVKLEPEQIEAIEEPLEVENQL